MNSSVKEKKKQTTKEFPHILVILLIIILVATVCTWLIPAGAYDRVLDEETGRMLIDPSSFHYLTNTPVSPFGTFVSLEKGMIEAAGITFFIFCAFASLYVVEKTGAIDAAIASMVRKTNTHPKYATTFIAVIMVGLSIWGSTGTLSYEEILAFVGIFVSVSLALGYDPMVGVAISVIPVGVGFACGAVNPFTVGVAQNIAELPMFSGLGYRRRSIYIFSFSTRLRLILLISFHFCNIKTRLNLFVVKHYLENSFL